MPLPTTMVPGVNSTPVPFNASISGNTVGILAQQNFYTLIAISGLTGSGATLTLEGCPDALGSSWTAVPAVGQILGASSGTLTLDDIYKVPSAGYAYFRCRVSTAGTRSISIVNGGGLQPQDVNVVGGAANSSSPDPAVAAGIGTPTDTPWSSGAGTLVALGKAIVGKLAGVLTISPAATTLGPGTTSIVATGNTPVIAITGPVKGGYIVNPVDAVDQGIATAEALYLDPVGTPGLSAVGTTCKLDLGGVWTLPGPIPAGVAVKVNAASAGHKFVCVTWS